MGDDSNKKTDVNLTQSRQILINRQTTTPASVLSNEVLDSQTPSSREGKRSVIVHADTVSENFAKETLGNL